MNKKTPVKTVGPILQSIERASASNQSANFRLAQQKVNALVMVLKFRLPSTLLPTMITKKRFRF